MVSIGLIKLSRSLKKGPVLHNLCSKCNCCQTLKGHGSSELVGWVGWLGKTEGLSYSVLRSWVSCSYKYKQSWLCHWSILSNHPFKTKCQIHQRTLQSYMVIACQSPMHNSQDNSTQRPYNLLSSASRCLLRRTNSTPTKYCLEKGNLNCL